MKKKIILLTLFCLFTLIQVNAQSWLTTGNTGINPNKNFIGTTDHKPFILRTNNKERLRVLPNGSVGIGTESPKSKLDVQGSINIAADSAYYINNVRILRAPFNDNLIIGQNAGHDLQASTHDNTACGTHALYLNETGSANTATGAYSLYFIDGSSNENTATGYAAMRSTEFGSGNSAVGSYALGQMIGGSCNVGVGVNALRTKGSSIGITGNTAVGYNSLLISTLGSSNTALGYNALPSSFAGSTNTGIGSLTDVNDSFYINNATAIGYQALLTAGDQVRVGNSSVTSIGGYVGWSNISDGRVKTNIKTNVPGLAFINKLQPVTYNLDLNAADKIVQKPPVKDKDGKFLKPTTREIEAINIKQQIVYTGFVAQDVERAARSVNYDFSGVDAPKNDKDLYALRYADFVAPLVKAVQELSGKNDELSKENEELRSRLDKLEQLMGVNNDAKAAGKLSRARLEQNMPNPFRGNTVISYYIPENAVNAAIRINDMNGKLLKSFSITAKGTGQLSVRADEIAAGMYQYALIVNGNIVDSKKMSVQ